MLLIYIVTANSKLETVFDLHNLCSKFSTGIYNLSCFLYFMTEKILQNVCIICKNKLLALVEIAYVTKIACKRKANYYYFKPPSIPTDVNMKDLG